MPPDDFWGAEAGWGAEPAWPEALGLSRNAVAAAGTQRDREVGGQGREGRYGAPGGAEERPVRSLVNIRAGKWTREMEANFRHHAQVLGYPVKPFAWPDGEVW